MLPWTWLVRPPHTGWIRSLLNIWRNNVRPSLSYWNLEAPKKEDNRLHSNVHNPNGEIGAGNIRNSRDVEFQIILGGDPTISKQCSQPNCRGTLIGISDALAERCYWYLLWESTNHYFHDWKRNKSILKDIPWN